MIKRVPSLRIVENAVGGVAELGRELRA